ncbi:hypothetical protein D4764_19G0008480 [Takifugu flavidus]|uniref:Uncharacterized protein n=1 Tax=Takifugu flavidus TaxID=433684 RepID=A0A5C6NQX8_9TELE|nr:hypothetical protein D4764_19G0008480 [Takifugu flavidus]
MATGASAGGGVRSIHSKEAGTAPKFLGVTSNASWCEEWAEERSPGVHPPVSSPPVDALTERDHSAHRLLPPRRNKPLLPPQLKRDASWDVTFLEASHLKEVLIASKGLLHRVLHHSFGSGPYISHRNETADGSTSSLPSHLPTCLSPPSARLSLRFPRGPQQWADVCSTDFN